MLENENDFIPLKKNVQNPLASGSNQANTVRAGSSAALVGEYNSGNSYGLGLSSLHQQVN